MPDNVFYNTAELVEVIETLRPRRRFFLDRFFRSSPYLSTREEIVFDEVLQDLPAMAPFVSPIVEAKPQARSGFQAKTFRPAYIKPKHFLKPGDFIRRQPGEDLLGSQTQQSRMAGTILDTLNYHVEQIEERLEWMAAQAVINGTVIVEGEDYPRSEVNFNRDPNNTVTISASDSVWSNADADIEGMLEDWSDQLVEKTGYAGTDIVMSSEVWKNFRKNNQIKEQADLRRGVRVVPDLQPQAAIQGVRDGGSWGDFRLWVYNGRFKNQDGEVTRALQPGEVLMTAAPDQESGTGGVNGLRCFGAIQDVGSMVPAQYYPKQWEEQDPSGIQLMTQSAPLMVPGRPNAVIKATVQ